MLILAAPMLAAAHARDMIPFAGSCLQVNQSTDFAELVDKEPWLKTTQLVVKPDMLFGKRGKNDLLALNVNISEAESFIHARMNKQVREGLSAHFAATSAAW